MKLFISPHCDDETLFGAFTIQRERPLVLIVFDSYVQRDRGTGILPMQRRMESQFALSALGVEAPRFLGFSDANPDWAKIETELKTYEVEQVWVPAWEEGGHEQHNGVARVTARAFGDRRTRYLTYTKAGKSTCGDPVSFTGEMLIRKLRALACYESQILLENTRPHFVRDQQEYYAS